MTIGRNSSMHSFMMRSRRTDHFQRTYESGAQPGNPYMFEKMISRHEEIDRAFRDSQQRFTQTADVQPMIEADANVHLFTGSEYNRTLVDYDGEDYISDGLPMDRASLAAELHEDPETFSNNVVTRPLMQKCSSIL